MSRIVFDASAMLALFLQEAGADTVRAWVPGGVASTVNIAEVGAKLTDRGGMTESEIRTLIGTLGLEVVSFDEDAAYVVALLRPRTRRHGLSLGDRACLALGINRGLPVLTADRSWAELDIGVDVRLIRAAS